MSAPIPLVDLKAQYATIKTEVARAIDRVLERGQFVLGPDVEAFEDDFGRYCGAQHAIATSSGTSALHLALLAANVGRDDEVITVPFTFVATVAAIRYVGARPVFVDVDPVTLMLDPARLEAAITPRTRAIIPVHLYGQPADMEPIVAVARRHGLVVIEDAAQAHGAEYRGRRAGRLGDLACFSFYPGKNLGAYGEGGLITTDNPDYAQTIRLLRNWGEDTRYHHAVQGFNYRMDAIQGAVLGVKLRHLEAWTERRRAHAGVYDARLARVAVRTPAALADRRHVYHLYVIRAPRRDALHAELQRRGIQAGIHYPIPVHLQKAHADLGYGAGDFPNAEHAAAEVLSLPMYPELSASQIERICATVAELAGDA